MFLVMFVLLRVSSLLGTGEGEWRACNSFPGRTFRSLPSVCELPQPPDFESMNCTNGLIPGGDL